MRSLLCFSSMYNYTFQPTVDKLQPGRKPNSFTFRKCRSTDTVEVTAASWEADRLRRTSRACAEETAGEAAARREEDQHQTAAAGTVRDLTLLTMWVLSPTIVVIFVQCIDCFGWDFWLMVCCPQISPCLYH